MSAADPHPRDAEALDYVLGVMGRDERRAFEDDLAADAALAAATGWWQERLAPLSLAVPSVEPSPALRERIEAAIAARAAPNVVDLSSLEMLRLRRSRGLWRAATVAAGALAAALAIWIAVPRPERMTGLVAVVNRTGDLPALIVRVDPVGRMVQVRSVASETPSGHSLELWAVAAGGRPRSLGVLPREGLVRMPMPAGRDGLTDGVTLAVSVEPPAGSPTGAPTGPVVYSGKLVPDMP